MRITSLRRDAVGQVWASLGGCVPVEVRIQDVPRADIERFVRARLGAKASAALGGWLDDLKQTVTSWFNPADDGAGWNSEGTVFGERFDAVAAGLPWADRWRREAKSYIQRLNGLAARWLTIKVAAERGGKAALVVEAEQRRAAYRKALDWVYFIVKNFLGGLDRLGGFAAVIPVLELTIKAAAVVVTVVTIVDWLDTEDERARVVEGEAEISKAEAEMVAAGRAMAESSDPQTAQAGRELVQTVGAARESRSRDDGMPGWLKVALGIGLMVGGGVALKRWQSQR